MEKIQRCVKMLRSKDERKHEEAREACFGMFGEEAGEALSALLPLLSHRQFSTRAGALRCIRSLGEFSFLGSGRFDALGGVDVEGLFSALLVALASKDYGVRESAKSVWIALAWRERESVVGTLMRGFKRVSDQMEREGRFSVFEAIHEGGLVGQLSQEFPFSSRKDKSMAARYWGEHGSDKAVRWLARWLREDSDYACYDATHALGRIGNVKAIRVLQNLFTHEDWRMRAAAVSALGEALSQRTLVSVYGEEQLSVQKRAVLGASDVAEVVATLLRALQDESRTVQSYAIDALTAIKAKEAVESLLKSMEEEGNPNRAQVLRALGELGDPRAITPLLGILEAPIAEHRAAAAYALGCLEAEEVIEPLLGLQNDPSDFVREAVFCSLGGLGRSGGERVYRALLAALSDNAISVRFAALRSLAYLGGKEAIEGVLALLDDPSEGLRLDAIRVLGQLGAKEAIAPLLSHWEKEDEYVQAEIGLALGKLGVKEQAKRMLPLLRSRLNQGTAVSALIQMEAFPAASAHLLLRMWEEAIRFLPSGAYFLWRDEENLSSLAGYLEGLREKSKEGEVSEAAEEWSLWKAHLGRHLPIFIEPVREMRNGWLETKRERQRLLYERSQKIADLLEKLLWVFQREAVERYAIDAEEALF
jgi:HEAT repeat protein